MKRKTDVKRVGKTTTDGLTDFERVAFYITLWLLRHKPPRRAIGEISDRTHKTPPNRSNRKELTKK